MDDCSRDAYVWAHHEFGAVQLGDARRRARVVKIAARAAMAPSGTVAGAFKNAAERQAAYDLLESKHASARQLLASMSSACVERCLGERYVYVPIDGTSIAVVDRKRAKNLGAVGSYKSRGRGIQAVTAIAVTRDGTSMGVCAQHQWARPVRRKKGGSTYRPVRERESRFLVDTVHDVKRAFAGSGVSPVSIIDRGGDATEILNALVSNEMLFVVRSSWNRRLATNPKTYLRPSIEAKPLLTSYELAVTAGYNRAARIATMDVRVGRLTLNLKHDWQGQRQNVTLNVVWAKERNPPLGTKPLHWILMTNLPVNTAADAVGVVTAYTRRWRIEEFHKTWKTGVCNVEGMQLRTLEAASKWATFLAAVAIRVERLKQLSRNEPDLPASAELTRWEIEATIVLKRMYKKKTEVIPDSMPTLGQAVLWIAELGSYAGKRGEKPGSITIARGLEAVVLTAGILEFQHSLRKKR